MLSAGAEDIRDVTTIRGERLQLPRFCLLLLVVILPPSLLALGYFL